MPSTGPPPPAEPSAQRHDWVMEGAAREGIFQSLKPHCVHLNQTVLQFAAGRQQDPAVVAALDELIEALEPVSHQLNRSLAEYAFFPLYHVLKETKRLRTKALVSTLRALHLLFIAGWKTDIPQDLGVQLFILLTFFAEGKATDGKPLESSEDLQDEAFRCLSAVLSSLGTSPEGQSALTATKMVPAVGNSVSVMLQGALHGATDGAQLSALTALAAFCSSIPDKQEILAGFLPGIVSTLTKILTPSTQSRRTYRVLVKSLDLLTAVLDAVVSDEAAGHLDQAEGPSESTTSTTGAARTRFDTDMLAEAASQIQLALANIMRQRHHTRPEVKTALSRLCQLIVERCQRTLPECQSMAVETLIFLAASDGPDEILHGLRQTTIAIPTFADLLKSRLHVWIISLPRVMEGHDDAAKNNMIRQISLAFEMLGNHQANLDVVDPVLASSLRDSLANAIKDRSKAGSVVASSTGQTSTDVAIMGATHHSTEFAPVILGRRNQEDTVKELARFVQMLSASSGAMSVSQELVRSLHHSSGDAQTASFWLALRMLQKSFDRREVDVSDILNIAPEAPDKNALVDEVYAFSLAVLTDSHTDSEADWRLQALALEAIAFQASIQGEDFHGELVEALYPVVHLIGSPLEELRLHAMTCLNIVASSCGFDNASDLLVQNVDYLVNSVALRLNSFDISPQAPQVLLMMVKLSGPALLPYLDDLVESIFAALELYHGYPKLVELLFSTLTGIAEEGSKSPQLLIASGDSTTVQSDKPTPSNFKTILAAVQSRRSLYEQEVDEEELEKSIKEAKSLRPSTDDGADGAAENDDGQLAEKDEKPPPPAEKTYNLLLNITRLAQHFLPSASPSLRTSLLTLLKTTFPALAKHEDSFLPLINTLWPVVFSRLSDPEAYIVSGTLEVMTLMCTHAGNFMRGRIEGAWDDVRRIYVDHTRRKPTSLGKGLLNTLRNDSDKSLMRQPPTIVGYVDAPSRMIWAGLVNLLAAIAEHVDVDEEIFDQIVEILLPVLPQRPDLRQSCERRNPDTVWLAMLKLQSRSPSTDSTGPIDQLVSFQPPTNMTKWRFCPAVV